MFKGFSLGKKATVYNPHIPMLARYMVQEVPKVASVNLLDAIKIPYGMMKNDTLGCCTIAGAGHLVMGYSAPSKTDLQLQMMSDEEVLTYYGIIGAYKIGDESTDNGCFMPDVLMYWMNTGIRFGTILNKIDGFASVDPKNVDLIRYALSEFGGLYMGIQLPQYCEDNTFWQIAPNMVVILAYCVTIQGMDDDNNFYGVSWGEQIKYSPDFIAKYADELYVTNNQHFTNPQGLDMSQLNEDLQKIKNKTIA